MFKGWFAALVMASLAGVPAHASLIVVSGDSNIGDPLVGDDGSSVIPGNQTFFSNLLGTGTKVVIDPGAASSVPFAIDPVNDIASYYNGITGVTATILSNPVTAGSLAGANLFIVDIPAATYSGSQISAISTFLSAGGTLLFMGENNSDATFVAADGFINADLAALGSSMQLGSASLDPGFNTATGTAIAAVPLAAGITSFQYASVTTVSGGTPIFFTTSGAPFVDFSGSSGPVVPEPATAVLVSCGLLTLAAARRFLRC